MSYILDALRRAEADRERERGQVPGLHTQTLSGDPPPSAAGGRRRWAPWAGGGLLLLAGLGVGSWWTSSPPVAPSPLATPSPRPASPPAEGATSAPGASAPVPAPVAQASASAPQATASVSPYLPPYLPPAPPPAAVAADTAPAPRAVAQAAPASASPPAPPPAADTRIPRLSELPESLRRELPRLAISGSVYSDDPASRFVIVNGEVQREGARLGADLVLEQIGPRELVLRFKGQRYRQPV